MASTRSYLQILKKTNPLRESTIQSAIKALQIPQGSRGLDVGCGIGLQIPLLAKAVGSSGKVVGLDQSAEFLVFAKNNIDKKIIGQISFKQGDIAKLLFEDNSFDWVWSCDCVGYPSGDLLPLLNEMRRIVKPGGKIAILGWTFQHLLPGYALLESRLNATGSVFIPHYKGIAPQRHFQRSLGWFQKAGLKKSTVKTFVGDICPPLNEETRTALILFFNMLWGERQSDIAKKDRDEFQRLCHPDSPDFILNIPDYYGFFVYSMFYGIV